MPQATATPTDVQAGIKNIYQQSKERDVQLNAKELEIPYINLIHIPVNPDMVQVIEKDEAIKAQAVCFFKSGKKIRLAIVDFQNPNTKALIEKFQEDGFEVKTHLCSEESMAAAQKIYFTERYKKKEVVDEEFIEKDLGSFEKEIENLEQLKNKIEASTYDVALNYIQVGAYKTHASDIHFQPEETDVLVRFRIDGILQSIFKINREIYQGIIKEIKHISHLKLNITNIPQDGQYVFYVNKRKINVRVSVMPSEYGETCVMRLLDPQKTFIDLSRLGFEGEALEYLQEAVRLSHGLILVTGPTGSGKTTTLYAMLKMIDVNTKKVITLEDPIEYNLDGITQSQIDTSIGYDFCDGLRAILRQDPDVIMVGEIRDLETAETAAQASLTGHLVFSTLHTNSAVESIPRLVNMGVKSFILAPAFDVIIAQRLVRRVCPACAEAKPITSTEKEHVELILQSMEAKGVKPPPTPKKLMHVKGCEKCSQTGFQGQITIAEVLRFSQELRDLILEDTPMPEIYEYIEKHCKMLSMHEDGILKVIKGVTTLDEVYRVAA